MSQPHHPHDPQYVEHLKLLSRAFEVRMQTCLRQGDNHSLQCQHTQAFDAAWGRDGGRIMRPGNIRHVQNLALLRSFATMPQRRFQST